MTHFGFILFRIAQKTLLNNSSVIYIASITLMPQKPFTRSIYRTIQNNELPIPRHV